MKVRIEKHYGRYRLRWKYQDKPFCMACGVSVSPIGEAIAKQKAAQIELDIAAGYFDPTLVKYRPQTIGRNRTELSCPELFSRFTEHQRKEKGLSPSTIQSKYRCVEADLKKHLDCPAYRVGSAQARDFAAILEERLKPATAKGRLWLLQSCWDWAKGRYSIAESNPWKGLAARIKNQPTQREKPFTRAEIQAIFGGFRSSLHYKHYADFVAFLFGTGCRFGEAAGLLWNHVADDCRTVWIGESVSRGRRKKSTKTGRARTVLLSESMTSMLIERRRQRQPSPHDLVFPSPQGKPIHDRNFCRRAWRKVLESVHIDYRRPYTTRHTAISHALREGANPIDLASQTGHDKKVLLETYAHVIEQQSLFVNFCDE